MSCWRRRSRPAQVERGVADRKSYRSATAAEVAAGRRCCRTVDRRHRRCRTRSPGRARPASASAIRPRARPNHAPTIRPSADGGQRRREVRRRPARSRRPRRAGPARPAPCSTPKNVIRPSLDRSFGGFGGLGRLAAAAAGGRWLGRRPGPRAVRRERRPVTHRGRSRTCGGRGGSGASAWAAAAAAARSPVPRPVRPGCRGVRRRRRRTEPWWPTAVGSAGAGGGNVPVGASDGAELPLSRLSSSARADQDCQRQQQRRGSRR